MATQPIYLGFLSVNKNLNYHVKMLKFLHRESALKKETGGDLEQSRATTVVPSPTVSHSDLEKETAPGTNSRSRSPSDPDTHEKITEGNALKAEEAEAANELDETVDVEYPTGIKLFVITLALCMSVFLVALVCFPSSYVIRQFF